MITVDREEFQIKLDEINSLVSRKNYKDALKIIKTIDWRKVKNVRTLCMVGEVYAANKKYSESREIFLLAYHRAQLGKTILYRLIEVSIKMNDLEEAQEYYEEFIRIAPKDNTRYVLQYKIAAAKKVPLEKQIQILEKHKAREMTERWSYELAKLYYKAGNYDKCIEACDDMVIWFHDGKYVIRALQLKMKLVDLTPAQQEIYEENLLSSAQEKEKTAKKAVEKKATEKKTEEPVEEKTQEPVKETAEEKAQEPVKEAAEEKAQEPVKEAVEEKAQEPVKEAVEEKAQEPVKEVAEEKAQEPVKEVAEEKAQEPVKEIAEEKTQELVKEEPKHKTDIETIVIEDEKSFQKRITSSIRDIFRKKFKPAEEELYRAEEDLKVMHTVGKINYSDVIPERVIIPDDVPPLEPEIIKQEPIEVAEPEPEVEEPVAEPEPEVEEPAAEPEPEVEEPVAEPEPEVEEPAAEPEPEIEEPVAEPEPEVEEPAAEPEPEVEEPAAEPEPEVEEPVAETEPEVEEPAAEPEPEVEEPAAEPPMSVEIPKLNLPKVNVNETAKVEDLPIEDKLSFNLEETILTAAVEQGIPLPKQSSEEKEEESVLEEKQEDEETVEETVEETETEEAEIAQPVQPEEEILSEEEELMRFIDEHSKNPNIEERDLVPREDVLNDEEEKLFKYFSFIPGMKEQLVEALKDTQMAAADQTSATGNVIVMGNRGSGKSTLSGLLVKAICHELKMPAAKVARISAQQMNGKDIGRIVSRLSGGFLLIYDANQMDAQTAEALNQAMELPTDGLTVIMEDEKIGMRKFIARNSKLIEKFTSTITIPVFTNDELVNFAKIYTNEAGYRIDEMAILALYSLISDNQKEDEPMTVGVVKNLLDDAISRAESGTRKLQRNLSKTRMDRDGFVVLYEKDFK